MVATHVRQFQKGKTYVYIPSFLRKDFDITPESKPDITKVGNKIVITFSGEGK
jgi:hypothetical protein